MKALKLVLLATLCLGNVTLAAAQPPTGEAAGGRPSPGVMAEPANPPPVKSPPAGPYLVTVESHPGLPTHTVYRPTDLAPFTGAQRLPIVAWGNGGCMNVGRAAEAFLSQIASHGYMVISSGPKDAALPSMGAGGVPPGGAPGGLGAQPPGRGGPPAGMPGGQTRDETLKTAIDWAIAENSKAGSAYAGKLNPDSVAVMGTSCGGLQAIANSLDPRIKTAVAWNSGTFPPGNIATQSMSAASKDTLTKMHAPIAYITGGPVDIAEVNAADDFSRITNVPVFYGSIDVGHGGTFRQPRGGRYAEVATAWLDWQLKSSEQAAKMFVGPDCNLCTDPVWTVKKKNMR